VSVMLASYLTSLGFSPWQVGAIVTGTLVDSAALTLTVGLGAQRFSRRRLLLGACALMAATRLGFARLTDFLPLFVVAVAGTLNPSSGDVSVFLPTEQAVLAQVAASRHRTALFAWYNLTGAMAAALGALASGIPVVAARRYHLDLAQAERGVFVVYAAVAIGAALVYARLSPAIEHPPTDGARGALVRSRATVFRLAALFSLDSMGGGLVVQSLLVLWLYRRFHLSVETAGAVF